jgi:electron transfer flavoprotein beta subunit
MNIAVLIKSVIATDEPIVVRGGEIDDGGVKKVINPYDEYGLEEALRIKESGGGTVTVISVGTEKTVEVLRTALAMGADEAVWINTADHEVDEHTCALLLASALKLKTYDLVWAGHLSVDNGAGQVAIRIAELLGWPHAGAVTACRWGNGEYGGSRASEGDGERSANGENSDADGDSASTPNGENRDILLVTRDAEGDSELWEVPLPALLTAQQGLNEPRYPALAGIMKAKRKPLTEMTPADLGVDLASGEAAPRTERLSCEAPPARPAGRTIRGSPREQATVLLDLLRNEAKVLKEAR